MPFCSLTYKKDIGYNWLLSKLELFRFKGASLSLLRDYLSDRTQFIVINSVNTESSYNCCAVSQASILGPRLFLSYINDLRNYNLSDVRMYADDTNLSSSKNPEELFSSLTHNLSTLKQWLDSKLSIQVLMPSRPRVCLQKQDKFSTP